MSKVTEVQAIRGDKRNRLVTMLAHGVEPGRAWSIVTEPGEDVEPTEYPAYGRLAAVLFADEVRKVDPRPVIAKEPIITRELLAWHLDRAMQTAVADGDVKAVADLAEPVRAISGIECDVIDDGRPVTQVDIKS